MIQLDNVTKFYGERLIFRDVTFKVADGEKIGIVGKSSSRLRQSQITRLRLVMKNFSRPKFTAGIFFAIIAEKLLETANDSTR